MHQGNPARFLEYFVLFTLKLDIPKEKYESTMKLEEFKNILFKLCTAVLSNCLWQCSNHVDGSVVILVIGASGTNLINITA